MERVFLNAEAGRLWGSGAGTKSLRSAEWLLRV